MTFLPLIRSSVLAIAVIAGVGAAHAESKTIYFKKASGGSTIVDIHVIQENDSTDAQDSRYYLSQYAKCDKFDDGVGMVQCKGTKQQSLSSNALWKSPDCKVSNTDVFMSMTANKISEAVDKASQRAGLKVEDTLKPVWVRFYQDNEEYFACVQPFLLEDGATITLQGGYDNGRNAYH